MENILSSRKEEFCRNFHKSTYGIKLEKMDHKNNKMVITYGSVKKEAQLLSK